MKRRCARIVIFVMVLILSSPAIVFSQYFGRNKPGYRSFKFDVITTPNFEIYHYLDNDTFVNYFAISAEEWYTMHKDIFLDTFSTKNPVILYTNHSDFQQTTAVGGMIGTTTGGVTESLKNRVVMPVAPTLAQTDHVLGHELVHAFQFNRLLNSDSAGDYSIRNIPLWMIEGMAEYFSIGSVDPNTAMWIRDAVVNDDFPTLKQLSTDMKYFPYRYGHAFWAMVGKTWGDSLIMPLFEKTARYGFERAVDSLFRINAKTLSGIWKSALETHFLQYINDSTEYIAGRKIISTKNAGRMNLSPSLSPDGKYLAFFSEKDVFTLDLYLAEAGSGRIIRKLSSITRNHEIDDFSFNESAGTWSPDSKRFAFVVYQKGKNRLAVVDVRRGKITEEFDLGYISSFSNPVWSPDGRFIAFSGLEEGISDLYLFDLRSGKITQMTNDFNSNIHPSWSPDGDFIVFSNERINRGNFARKYSFDLNIIDVKTLEIRILDIFPGADNLNPFYSHDGKSIYFLSNADGFRNLYRYDLQTDELFRMTQYNTGISGLTPLSPALSVAGKEDMLAYTHYFKASYNIVTASSDDFREETVDRSVVDFEAGTLPPLLHYYNNIVDANLYNRGTEKDLLPFDSIKQVPYQPRFQLDYISNTAGIGVSTSRYHANNMSGSVNMIFSDMVGNNQLYSVLSLNGEIYDFGGQIAYINQSKKFNWGAYVSHIPYRTGNMFYTRDTLTYRDKKTDKTYSVPVTDLVLDYIRMFVDNISFFTYHAFSQTRRIEAGASLAWYYYRIDRYHQYYDDFGLAVGMGKERRPTPDGNNYQKVDMAYVTDNSFFGMTSPMRGQRARYQLEKYFGAVDFFTGLVDFRKYYFMNPVTAAFRFYHYGRYGPGSESRLVSPIYIGYPWLIRGYENLSFYGTEMSNMPGFNTLNYSHLSGTKVLVANAELRVPLTGPKILALFGSKYLMTDFNLFFDAGLAWQRGDKPKITWESSAFNQRVPVFSAGASVRVNLLGYMVLEPYFAVPFQNGGWQNRNFGLNFLPGW